MTIPLNFNQYSNYKINENRLNHMMKGSKTEVTHMGLWDQFKDLFRIESKAEALSTLYDLIHDEKSFDKEGLNLGAASLFLKLKSFAGDSFKDRFVMKFNADIIEFSVNEVDIKKVKISDAISDIKINGNEFVSNYEDILVHHESKLSGKDIEEIKKDVQDLEKYAVHFFNDNPSLDKFIINCHIQNINLKNYIQSNNFKKLTEHVEQLDELKMKHWEKSVNGVDYNLVRIFRDFYEARDSVQLVEQGGKQVVLKSGPNIPRELTLMKQLETSNHDNVVHLIDSAEKDMIVEFCEHGPLSDFKGKIKNGIEAIGLIKGIIEGLSYCHEKGIVHGDIGEQNIFISDSKGTPVAKIGDFGESLNTPEDMLFNLASDIFGACNVIQDLSSHLDVTHPAKEKVELLKEKARALVMVSNNARACDQSTINLYRSLGERLPPRGNPPTMEQISELKREFYNLLAEY